jgi:ABC-type nitrate/sulfonate/bicarbonate transport system substrate-binding protein
MRKSSLVAIGCAAVLSATLAGCGSSGPAASKDSSGNYQLTELDATTSLLNVPTAAVQQDFGADHGIKVTANAVTGGGTANQQFAGGESNLLVAGVDSPMRIHQQGVTDMTVLASIAKTNVWVLVTKKGSPIKSLKDLEGKKIGISGPGAASDITLRYELKKAGVDPSKTKIVALGAAPTQLAALEKGNADAVQLLSPVLDNALKNKQVQILFDFRDEDYPALTVSARTEDIEKDPKPYCSYLAALHDGMDKVIGDKDYAMQVGTKLMGNATTQADMSTVLDDYIANRYAADLSFTKEQYDTAKAILTDSGVVPSAGFPGYDDLTKGLPNC